MDPLRFIKFAWVIEGALLILGTIFYAPFATIAPNWMAALPTLSIIVGAQGAAAFGGPAIKRAQNGGIVPGGE